MSRPSRGTSRGVDTVNTGFSCPTSGASELSINSPADWIINFSWTSPLTVVTCTIQFQLNGGGWITDSSQGPVTDQFDFEPDPNDYGSPGDFLEFRCQCTDVIGCPDFLCVAVGSTIE